MMDKKVEKAGVQQNIYIMLLTYVIRVQGEVQSQYCVLEQTTIRNSPKSQ